MSLATIGSSSTGTVYQMSLTAIGLSSTGTVSEPESDAGKRWYLL
jgi:hypothetical protein